ncbi:hypothetical protein HDU76_007563 [Blyttiomyces sp. JEL0837]|nr:hypothetical protein HDU76_007563 [Blyttiomyces sp. JEL0837]
MEPIPMERLYPGILPPTETFQSLTISFGTVLLTLFLSHPFLGPLVWFPSAVLTAKILNAASKGPRGNASMQVTTYVAGAMSAHYMSGTSPLVALTSIFSDLLQSAAFIITTRIITRFTQCPTASTTSPLNPQDPRRTITIAISSLAAGLVALLTNETCRLCNLATIMSLSAISSSSSAMVNPTSSSSVPNASYSMTNAIKFTGSGFVSTPTATGSSSTSSSSWPIQSDPAAISFLTLSISPFCIRVAASVILAHISIVPLALSNLSSLKRLLESVISPYKQPQQGRNNTKGALMIIGICWCIFGSVVTLGLSERWRLSPLIGLNFAIPLIVGTTVVEQGKSESGASEGSYAPLLATLACYCGQAVVFRFAPHHLTKLLNSSEFSLKLDMVMCVMVSVALTFSSLMIEKQCWNQVEEVVEGFVRKESVESLNENASGVRLQDSCEGRGEGGLPSSEDLLNGSIGMLRGEMPVKMGLLHEQLLGPLDRMASFADSVMLTADSAPIAQTPRDLRIMRDYLYAVKVCGAYINFVVDNIILSKSHPSPTPLPFPSSQTLQAHSPRICSLNLKEVIQEFTSTLTETAIDQNRSLRITTDPLLELKCYHHRKSSTSAASSTTTLSSSSTPIPSRTIDPLQYQVVISLLGACAALSGCVSTIVDIALVDDVCRCYGDSGHGDDDECEELAWETRRVKTSFIMSGGLLQYLDLKRAVEEVDVQSGDKVDDDEECEEFDECDDDVSDAGTIGSDQCHGYGNNNQQQQGSRYNETSINEEWIGGQAISEARALGLKRVEDSKWFSKVTGDVCRALGVVVEIVDCGGNGGRGNNVKWVVVADVVCR